MGSFDGRVRHWGRLALANPVAFAATFSVGAFLAFGYSYVPLHTVKDRKLDRLEVTVIDHELTISGLEGELEEFRSLADQTTDEVAVAALESDREQARREIESARNELAKAKKRAKRLERERNQWKGKVASLESQLADLAVLQLVDADTDTGAEPELAREPTETPSALAGARPPGAEGAAAPAR